MNDSDYSYPWYANQLGISLRTAKRKGKVALNRALKAKEKDLKEKVSPLIEKAFKKGEQNLNKNLDNNFFFNMDEKQVNEESRKIGIELLNKTLKGLVELVEGIGEMPVYQRSCVLIGIAKMILGVR